MQLTAIFGPPGAGKARQVVEAVLEHSRLPGGVYLVVPGPVDRSRYLRELAARSPMLLDVEVGTWSGLVERLAAAPARRSNAALERVVVRDALDAVPELARARRYSGFVDTARRVVAELRMAEVWSQRELARVVATLPGGSSQAWRALATRYGELLVERRLHDAAWFEARAAGRLARGHLSIGAVVAIDHSVPAGIRVELAERLALHVPVTIAMPWRPGRDLHEPAARLRDRWTGADHRAVIVRDVMPGAARSVPALEWMAAGLFEQSPGPSPTVGSAPMVSMSLASPSSNGDGNALKAVGFVDCCGRAQELEEVVREVARLVATGIAPGSIAVAAAGVSGDAEQLALLLRSSGIPAAPMAIRRAPDAPAGRAILDLVRAVLEDDPRRLVAAFAAPIVPATSRSVHRADLALRGSGARVSSIDAAMALPAVRAATSAELRTLHVAARSGSSVLPAVRAMLATLTPQDDGDLRLLSALAHELEALATASGGEQRVELGDVAALIELHALEVPDVSGSDAVAIAAIRDLGSVRFDALVLYGMHDGGFRIPSEVLLDGPSAARDLLHLAVTRPRRALRIVRRAIGEDGGVVAPHPVWRELRRLADLLSAADVEARTRRLGAVLPDPEDVLLPRERALSVALARSAGRRVDGVEQSVEIAIEAAHYVPGEERIAGAVLERLASRTRIGATELEQWSKCPARWLLDRQLSISDVDADALAMVVGSYAHALLERMVPALHDRGVAIGIDELRTELQAAREGARRSADRHGILDPHDIARAERWVEETILAEQDWSRPDAVLTEVALDMRSASADERERTEVRGSRPPWAPAGLDVGGVEVHGRVDRIDRYGDEVVLHDYKSAKSSPSPATLVANHRLQLPLYWLAVERTAGAPRPVAAVYRQLPKQGTLMGLRSGRLLDLGVLRPGLKPPTDEVLRGVLDSAELRAGEIIAGMRDGELSTAHIDPRRDDAPCRHCSFAGICRIDDRSRVRRAEGAST